MKRTPIPTAPSERPKWQTNPPKRVGWLVLTLLLSLATGFSGALLAKVYQLDMLTPTAPDIIVVPDNTTSGSASIVRSLQERQGDAVVIVRAGVDTVGTGVILSSDGWIVTAVPVLSGDHTFTVQTQNGKQYTSDQLVVDEVTGLTYLHVDQSGLRVAEFRNDELLLGESLVVYGRNLDSDVIAFASVSTSSTLDRELLTTLIGAPLYDLEFTIVGFTTDTAEIIPIEAVNEVAYGLFTTGSIIRTPAL